MQCPNCGFENIPGNEQCVVCSTALPTKHSGESLMPPRARDRTWWQKLTWPITTSRSWVQTGEDLRRCWEKLGDGWSNAWAASPASWMGMREFGLILLSVIPGLGHICVRGERRTGLWMLLGSVAALGLAALVIKTVLADLLVAGVIAASMYSVCATMDVLRPMGRDETRFINRAGVGLWILAAYLGTYWLLMLALRPHFMLATVVYDQPNQTVAAHDRLLLRREQVYHRGDIIAGSAISGMRDVGEILAAPGDTIRLNDKVHVNGAFTGIRVPIVQSNEGIQRSLDIEYTLGKDEYWIMPPVGSVGDVGMLLEAGTITGSRIWGRALLVIGPPEHRRYLVRHSVDR